MMANGEWQMANGEWQNDESSVWATDEQVCQSADASLILTAIVTRLLPRDPKPMSGNLDRPRIFP